MKFLFRQNFILFIFNVLQKKAELKMTLEPTTSADQDNQENGAAQAEQQAQPAEHHPQKV
jgi:hypothetical protein